MGARLATEPDSVGFRRGFGHADLTNAAAALYDLLATFKRSPDRRSPARWVRVSQARPPTPEHTEARAGWLPRPTRRGSPAPVPALSPPQRQSGDLCGPPRPCQGVCEAKAVFITTLKHPPFRSHSPTSVQWRFPGTT